MSKRCMLKRLMPLLVMLIISSAARAATSGSPSSNLVSDLTQFFVDGDKAAAAEANAAADRLLIANDVNTNSPNLKTDVTQFFKDHDAGVNQEDKRITERHELYFDLSRKPIQFTKPGKGSSDLPTAVKQFFTDYDERVAADAAIDADLINWRVSLTTNNTVGLTSNGNQFFDDRHSLVQDRRDVNADCANLRRITKDKASKVSVPKFDKSMDLQTAAKNFTTARANWDTAEVTLTTAISNMRAAQGGSSLESTVTAFLDARHNRAATGILLNAARFQMRFSTGLVKTPKATIDEKNEPPKAPKPPKGQKPAPKGENEAPDDSSSGEEGNDPDAGL